jgi:hypothetical protein
MIQERPELFKDWSEEDFADLYSRFAAGGPMTDEGIVAAAEHINRRHELMNVFMLTYEGNPQLVDNVLTGIYNSMKLTA